MNLEHWFQKVKIDDRQSRLNLDFQNYKTYQNRDDFFKVLKYTKSIQATLLRFVLTMENYKLFTDDLYIELIRHNPNLNIIFHILSIKKDELTKKGYLFYKYIQLINN